MAFIWSSNPNYPVVAPEPSPGPDTISYDQHVVANTVNVHGLVLGTLSYNTANKGYDVIYELPSLNVRTLHAQTLTAVRATINTAFINTATINTATINTANIGTATISIGMLGVHPVQNLQIATKEYVDTLIANSTPLGGNIQLLIIAAGDLLVGVSDNTAERLPIGTANGQVLVAGGASNTGLHWSSGPRGSASSHRGLFMGTNPDETYANDQVIIISVDEIVMDDGTRTTTGWAGKIANIRSNVATSGVGFLDTGEVRAQTCYEIWAIRNSSSGAQGLILHRAVERFPDVNHRANPATTTRRVNFAYGAGLLTCINVSQSFIATNTGPFTGIDLTLAKTGSPIGNCWVTLEANNSVGNASGIPLATSRYLDTSRMINESVLAHHGRIRFPFDTTANVISGNSYHCVFHVDYPIAGSTNLNYITIFGNTGNTYLSGIAKDFSANTNTWVVANTSSPAGPTDFYFRTYVESFNSDLLMPAGYDQKALISYTSTSGTLPVGSPSPFLGRYTQRGSKMSMPITTSWDINYNGLFGGGGGIETTMTGRCEAIDMRHFVPPVPCFVTFTMIQPSGAGFFHCIGGIASTDIGPVSASGATLVDEAEGQISGNATQATASSLGPMFVEHQVVLFRTGQTLETPYVGEVEF